MKTLIVITKHTLDTVDCSFIKVERIFQYILYFCSVVTKSKMMRNSLSPLICRSGMAHLLWIIDFRIFSYVENVLVTSFSDNPFKWLLKS